jgi:hypothetical protein
VFCLCQEAHAHIHTHSGTSLVLLHQLVDDNPTTTETKWTHGSAAHAHLASLSRLEHGVPHSNWPLVMVVDSRGLDAQARQANMANAADQYLTYLEGLVTKANEQAQAQKVRLKR